MNKKNIEDFFEKRFFNAIYYEKTYIQKDNNGLRVLLHNGNYGKSVRYLNFLEKVMQFELKNEQAKMGKDCALLEILPCKSKLCKGMNKEIIYDFVNTHFKKLLEYLLNGETETRTFVVFGRKSAETFYNIIKSLDDNSANPSSDFASDFDDIWGKRRLETLEASIFGKQIKVVFSYHSSARNFSFEKYKDIRNHF